MTDVPSELAEMLQYLIEMHGTDLFVKAGTPPHVRIDGHLHPTPFGPTDGYQTQAMVRAVLPATKEDELAGGGEVDFTLSAAGLGRFRVHAYRQRSSHAMVFRQILPTVPDWDRLGLPPVVERLANEERGLVLVSGPAGSGRTTTLNAFVDHINEHRAVHIITVEDPVEYLHPDKRSIISQREVGTDTSTMSEAVRRATKHGADVLVIGSLDDVLTLRAAIAAAESGHLVIAATAIAGAIDTIGNLVEMYPLHQQAQARNSVASVLRAVISQRLLDRADGKGRIAAVEVLVNSPRARECLTDGARHAELERVIVEGEYHGMQSLDQSLLSLCKEGLVSLRDAVVVANRPEELRLQLQQAAPGLSF